MRFKGIRNRLKSKSKTCDERKFKDKTVDEVTNVNEVAHRKLLKFLKAQVNTICFCL